MVTRCAMSATLVLWRITWFRIFYFVVKVTKLTKYNICAVEKHHSDCELQQLSRYEKVRPRHCAATSYCVPLSHHGNIYCIFVNKGQLTPRRDETRRGFDIALISAQPQDASRRRDARLKIVPSSTLLHAVRHPFVAISLTSSLR
jgi:hypothetical protein